MSIASLSPPGHEGAFDVALSLLDKSYKQASLAGYTASFWQDHNTFAREITTGNPPTPQDWCFMCHRNQSSGVVPTYPPTGHPRYEQSLIGRGLISWVKVPNILMLSSLLCISLYNLNTARVGIKQVHIKCEPNRSMHEVHTVWVVAVMDVKSNGVNQLVSFMKCKHTCSYETDATHSGGLVSSETLSTPLSISGRSVGKVFDETRPPECVSSVS